MSDSTAILLAIALFVLYFLPFTIALFRGHQYKWVILGLNTIGFAGIAPWIISFIWAVWPTNRSLADPIAGNVTGLGRRNAGDTYGAVTFGSERGYAEEKEAYLLEELERRDDELDRRDDELDRREDELKRRLRELENKDDN